MKPQMVKLNLKKGDIYLFFELWPTWQWNMLFVVNPCQIFKNCKIYDIWQQP